MLDVSNSLLLRPLSTGHLEETTRTGAAFGLVSRLPHLIRLGLRELPVDNDELPACETA